VFSVFPYSDQSEYDNRKIGDAENAINIVDAFASIVLSFVIILLIVVIMAMSSCSSSANCIGSEWANERPVINCENCDEID